MNSHKQTLYPLIWPLFILIFSSLFLWNWPFFMNKVREISEINALLILFPWLPYFIFSIIMIMAWRYNNSGLMLTACVVALSYYVFNFSGSGVLPSRGSTFSILDVAAFLFPLNIVLFSLLTKRRIYSSTFLICLGLIALQVLAVMLFLRWPNSSQPPLWEAIHKALPQLPEKMSDLSTTFGSWFFRSIPVSVNDMTLPALLVFGGALLFLLNRFMLSNDAILAGFMGTLGAVFLGVTARQVYPGTVLFFTAAGIILIVSTIESTYYMAYIDELTRLHGRRSLNETLINLGHKYAIAMIDLDHFKKVNDTYGHKVGDQVLRMIAVHLEKMSGGAKTFRYGGEEFAAIFPGKSAAEAQLHLERYRQTVASTPFIVRGKDRRKRSEEDRGKGNTAGQKVVKVTVSIGVSEPDKDLTTPETVLKAADQALYKAKKAGRNRLKIQKAST